MDFDVIIIGGGAAGISAALWCDELGMQTLLLESDAELGGQLLRIYNEIKNHLGAEAENGRELRDYFVRQTVNRKFKTRLESKVETIDLDKKTVQLETGEIISARAIIVAVGVRRRKLDAAGEDEFQNRGIIRSGKLDRDFCRNKTVVIIGGGDAAFENSLILAEVAEKVFLVNRGKIFRARLEFVEPASRNPKIEILNETIVTKFSGEKNLESVELKNNTNGETKILAAQAALIRIGVAPATEIFRGQLDLDADGYIEIDSRCQTSAAGIFAVGDAANPIAPTVSSAVGMGATAAKAVADALSS